MSKPIPQRWLDSGCMTFGPGYWEMGSRRANMGEWKEGARVCDASDLCPGCGLPGCLAYDFKKLGKHTMHYCSRCRAIFVDGQKASAVEMKGGA